MKKLLALMLSVMMVICMMPGMAFAADTQPETPTTPPTSTEIVDLSKATIGGIVDKTYTGSEIKQNITVNESAVTEADVTITYSRADNNSVDDKANINAGEVTVKIEAKDTNKFSNSAIKTFTIKKADLSECTTQAIGNQEIGAVVMPPDLVFNEKTVTNTENKEYTVSPESITTVAGVNSFTYTASANGNFTGTKYISYLGANLLTDKKYGVLIPSTLPTVNYTGKPVTPYHTYRVYAKKDDGTLDTSKELSSQYYTVSFEGNTNVNDSRTVVITGKNGYAGTIEVANAFQINPRDISYCSFDYVENQVSGSDIEITIKDGNVTLQKDRDYNLNTDTPGKLIVTGGGNYTGHKEFNIKYGTSIKYAAVTMYPETFEYTGSAIYPTHVTVKLGTKYLREYTDYKIVYENNTKVGTAKMRIIGLGDYAGTIEKTFPITAKSLTGVDTKISYPESVLYDGRPVIPAVSVTSGGRTLVNGVDYDVRCYNNDKIGTATLYVTGKGNYAGSVFKTFKIVGRSIETASVTLSSYHYNYTGLECKPSVTVYDGYKRLYSGTDYTVEYKNNRNAGTASVVITGKGNYSGTKTINFTINGKDQTVTTNYTYYTKYLTSDSFNLGAKHDGDGILTYTSSNPEVASVSAFGTVMVKETGIAYITVATKNTVKYNPAEKVVKITVKPKKPVIKVTSPAKKQIKVQITKVAGATKYQVRYGRMGNYYNKYVTHVNDWNDTVSTTIGNRTSGKNYFVKVRAYKTMSNGEKAWGNWTTVRKVKAK